jgi:hypothetical protein
VGPAGPAGPAGPRGKDGTELIPTLPVVIDKQSAKIGVDVPWLDNRYGTASTIPFRAITVAGDVKPDPASHYERYFVTNQAPSWVNIVLDGSLPYELGTQVEVLTQKAATVQFCAENGVVLDTNSTGRKVKGGESATAICYAPNRWAIRGPMETGIPYLTYVGPADRVFTPGSVSVEFGAIQGDVNVPGIWAVCTKKSDGVKQFRQIFTQTATTWTNLEQGAEYIFSVHYGADQKTLGACANPITFRVQSFTPGKPLSVHKVGSRGARVFIDGEIATPPGLGERIRVALAAKGASEIEFARDEYTQQTHITWPSDQFPQGAVAAVMQAMNSNSGVALWGPFSDPFTIDYREGLTAPVVFDIEDEWNFNKYDYLVRWANFPDASAFVKDPDLKWKVRKRAYDGDDVRLDVTVVQDWNEQSSNIIGNAGWPEGCTIRFDVSMVTYGMESPVSSIEMPFSKRVPTQNQPSDVTILKAFQSDYNKITVEWPREIGRTLHVFARRLSDNYTWYVDKNGSLEGETFDVPGEGEYEVWVQASNTAGWSGWRTNVTRVVVSHELADPVSPKVTEVRVDSKKFEAEVFWSYTEDTQHYGTPDFFTVWLTSDYGRNWTMIDDTTAREGRSQRIIVPTPGTYVAAARVHIEESNKFSDLNRIDGMQFTIDPEDASPPIAPVTAVTNVDGKRKINVAWDFDWSESDYQFRVFAHPLSDYRWQQVSSNIDGEARSAVVTLPEGADGVWRVAVQAFTSTQVGELKEEFSKEVDVHWP